MELAEFFKPESVAIVGASSRPESISGQFLKNLTGYGFSGRIYPVNPKAREVGGHPCHARVVDIPDQIDVAVILVPRDFVCGALEDCAKKHVRYVIVPAAGFAEAGAEGQSLQRRMMEIVAAGNMRMMGPNCMGYINFKDRIVVSFGAFLEGMEVRKGNVGLVAHSGAFGGQTVRQCMKRGVSFTYSISTGNEADLHALDFLEFLVEDPDTQVIAAFLENTRAGDQMVKLGRKAQQMNKVFIVLKAGKSARGGEAVSSHTGRIAGAREIYEGIFKQGRIVEALNPEEFWDSIEVFSKVRPYPNSFGVCAVVASGGNGILACDSCETFGLEMAPIREGTREALSELIPDAGSTMNPIDVTAQIPHNELEKLPRIVDILCQEPDVGILLVSIADRHFTRCWKELLQATCRYEKFLAVVNSSIPDEIAQTLNQSGRVIVGDNVWRALRKVEILKRNHEFRQSRGSLGSEGGSPGEDVRIALPLVSPNEYQAKALFSPYISMPRSELSASVTEAVEAAERIGYPVVLKLSAPGLKHKSDIKGVCVDIRNTKELKTSFSIIKEGARSSGVDFSGVLVEEMVKGGVEVVMGFIRHPEVGPLIMMGAGGVLVELWRRVAFRVLPISRNDAVEMLEETGIHTLLKRFRNQPEKDAEALLDAVFRLSRIFLLNSWIQELEFNPVAVLDKGQGVKALDVLVTKAEIDL